MRPIGFVKVVFDRRGNLSPRERFEGEESGFSKRIKKQGKLYRTRERIGRAFRTISRFRLTQPNESWRSRGIGSVESKKSGGGGKGGRK